MRSKEGRQPEMTGMKRGQGWQSDILTHRQIDRHEEQGGETARDDWEEESDSKRARERERNGDRERVRERARAGE